MAEPSRVTVGTAAVRVLASNGARVSYLLLNRGSSPVFVGNDNQVSTTNGFQMNAGEALSIGGDHDEVWAVAEQAGQVLHVLETTVR